MNKLPQNPFSERGYYYLNLEEKAEFINVKGIVISFPVEFIPSSQIFSNALEKEVNIVIKTENGGYALTIDRGENPNIVSRGIQPVRLGKDQSVELKAIISEPYEISVGEDQGQGNLVESPIVFAGDLTASGNFRWSVSKRKNGQCIGIKGQDNSIELFYVGDDLSAVSRLDRVLYIPADSQSLVLTSNNMSQAFTLTEGTVVGEISQVEGVGALPSKIYGDNWYILNYKLYPDLPAVQIVLAVDPNMTATLDSLLFRSKTDQQNLNTVLTPRLVAGESRIDYLMQVGTVTAVIGDISWKETD